MKRKALTLAFALAAAFAQAESGKSLIVSFNDGTRVEFALSTTPDVSFANDQMTVASTSTTANYELWTVSTFTYGESSGINGVADDHFTMQGDKIIIDGEACKVSAYSIDGKAVSLCSSAMGGKTIVSLDPLGRGAYIIKINNKAIKITRQ